MLSPTGPTEIAWYAGGGGSSLLEPTPAFQSTTKVGGGVPILRRGVPDVSPDADPESGYIRWSYGFPAAPGWDYTTGRGTPDITAFVNGA